jgi:hypothetical protein
MGKKEEKIKKRLQEITEIVQTARKSNYLLDLNEYLRKTVMGPHGDTKFDSEFIKTLNKENIKWRKKSLSRKKCDK